jgi:SNF2 family DNA or RNA helicase
MAHQVAGSQWLAGRFRCLALDPPGGGKTLQALMAASQVPMPLAVVCPAVAVGVWQEEIELFNPGAAVRVQSTTKPVDAPSPGEYLITTYDRANITPAPHRYGLVLDEAHLVKNARSDRTKRVTKLVAQARGYCWAQTGTPILKDPDDLWGILTVLGIEKQTYRNRDNFLAHWGGHYMMGELRWRGPRANAWQPLLPLMLRRERKDMYDLPARTHEQWALKLSDADHKRFQSIADRFPAEDEDWERWATGGELASALERLSLVKASLALAPIRDLCPTVDNPVVVFTAHREAAKLLAVELGWPSITGATSEDARTRIAQEFQQGKHAGVVCTIQAAGVALTLTRAAICVFVSQTWVNAANSQAEDRLYRIRQLRDVRTIFCRSNSALEKSIDKVLARKVKFLTIPEVVPYEAVR